MIEAFRHIHMPTEIAVDFIAVFSRMEYALKSTRYAVGNERKVAPAWDRFANDIDEAFREISDSTVQGFANYILENPPRKQVLRDGRLSFADQEVDTGQRKTQQLLLMIRTIRNNLFHGGKYLPDGEVETGRNKILVEASLAILMACVELDADVKSSFER